MAPLIWKTARTRAREVRAAYWDDSFPVDPYRICEEMGIGVFEGDLDPKLSGVIIKRRNEDARILLSRNDSEVRKTFTCAHELGHYVERADAKDLEFSFVEKRADGHYDLHEFFADEFAGELLMPEDRLRRELAAGKSRIELAKFFGVSAAALNKRVDRINSHPYVAV